MARRPASGGVMSRTDKTKPLLFNIWYGDLARQDRHRHGGDLATCDLPATLAEALARHGRGRCHWSYLWTGTNECCGFCRPRIGWGGVRTKDRGRLSNRVKAWNAGDPDAFDDVDAALRIHY